VTNPLRQLFGPSRNDIWRQLSADLGGQYVAGGTFRSAKVQATHGEWTVTLDTHAVRTGNVTIVYTRMRAPFVNPGGFRFTIYRRGLFSDIAKWLGMQDVQVGVEPFDSDFIVKGTDEAMVRSLFSKQRLRDLVTAQDKIYLTVKDDEGWFAAKFPEGVDELYFNVVGVIKDLDRLKLLYELFSETLDDLCATGSAYAANPNFKV
jgi:hypothetical protein